MTFDTLADLLRGATFDGFLLRPQYSVLARRDPSLIDLSCRFSTNITLHRPLVSANMDTVTRAPMAIVQAEAGRLGIIDRGFRNGDIEPQVREVAKATRMQQIIIRDPYSVAPEAPLADAAELMRHHRAGTLVVVDGDRTLKGPPSRPWCRARARSCRWWTRRARGSVRPLMHDIFKHLGSSISSGGAGSLQEWKQMFRADPMKYRVKLSASVKRGSYQG